jgi:hypothetical protein
MLIKEVEHQSELEVDGIDLNDYNFTGFNDRANLDVSYISNNMDEQNAANDESLEKDFFRMLIVAIKLIFTEDHDVDYLGDIDPEELYS